MFKVDGMFLCRCFRIRGVEFKEGFMVLIRKICKELVFEVRVRVMLDWFEEDFIVFVWVFKF